MKSSGRQGQKLLYFLRANEGYHLAGFRNWLESPLLGNSPQLLQLLDIIEKEVLSSGEHFVDPALLAGTVQPERVLDGPKLKYIGMRLSNLQQKFMDFLAFQGYQKQESTHLIYQLQESINQGLDKFVPGQYKKVRRKFELLKTTQDFADLFQLDCLVNAQLSRNAFNSGSSNLQDLEASMDHYFILQKLKYGCASLNDLALGGKSGPNRLLNGILEEVGAQPKAFPGLIQAYYHAYEMLLEPLGLKPGGHPHFSAYTEVFTQKITPGTSEAQDLFIHGQNYCILQIRAGKEGFRKEIADFYTRSLQSGVLEQDAHLSPALYKNCVEVLCKCGLYAEAEKLSQNFKGKISPDWRVMAFTYNLAVIELFKGNPAVAARHLQKLIGSLKGINYELGTRVYLCRALWEIADYERLEENLHSFSQYLLRNKTKLGEQVKQYRKFVSYLRRMNGIARGPALGMAERYGRLLEEIEEKEGEIVFGWLRGKLRGLRPVAS
jgi:hypothetical protein